MKDLQALTRPCIWNLQPYSSARDEYSNGAAEVFLDANENPYNAPYNRYPDPLQWELKKALSKIKKVAPENMCLGNGSDELIDLCFRCFCEPGKDNVVAIEPTYGMYKVCADINNVEYRRVLLDEHFGIQAERLLENVDQNTKLIWLCSPNNPTGNSLEAEEIETVLNAFDGLVIVDEAYSDFAKAPQFRLVLNKFPNLIVLNTFSKAWGCASIRLGMAFASTEIIAIFNKVKYPYNVNKLTQRQALEMLKDPHQVTKWVRWLLQERVALMEAFRLLPICKEVYPTDANFFLAKMDDATAIYNYLVDKGVIVRNRSKITLCDNCLRITVGTKSENNELLSALRQYDSSK